MIKSAFDLIVASLGLIVLSPLLLAIAVLIKLDSPGPIFFRQVRVGQHGRLFRIHKFRTMAVDADSSRQITVGNDPRITRIGSFLRRRKLDELPQLMDVVFGHMSLVGPRPEVPKYVAVYPPDTRALVLSVKPGITDLASIEYREENDLLAAAPDPETAYVQEILPIKLAYYRRYVETHTILGDVGIILRTIFSIAK